MFKRMFQLLISLMVTIGAVVPTSIYAEEASSMAQTETEEQSDDTKEEDEEESLGDFSDDENDISSLQKQMGIWRIRKINQRH